MQNPECRHCVCAQKRCRLDKDTTPATDLTPVWRTPELSVRLSVRSYPTEDIIAGLCASIVLNYLNNVGKGKHIAPPIVFQGGVSKNVGVVRAFERVTGYPIVVDDLGHLMGAIGVAILARRQQRGQRFDFDIKDIDFRTVGIECGGCPNDCEVVCVLRDSQFLDAWGNRCPAGIVNAKKRFNGHANGNADALVETASAAGGLDLD